MLRLPTIPIVREDSPPRWDEVHRWFDAEADPEFVTDRIGIVQELNAAARILLAAEPEALLGRPLSAFMHPSCRPAFRQAVNELAHVREVQALVRFVSQTGAPHVLSLRGRSTDVPGVVLWSVSPAEPRPDPPSEPATASPCAPKRADGDVTPRSALGKDHVDSLHELVHALRAATEPDLPRPVRDGLLDRIRRDLLAQAGVAALLLDVRHGFDAEVLVRHRPLDLAALARGAVAAELQSAGYRGVALKAECEDELLVRGEELQLQHVVSTLILNAIKFTSKRGRIDVRAQRLRGRAVLSVTDSGQGIAPSALRGIFEAPIRGGAARGFSLFVIKRLVKAHGGVISAHSEGQDRGSIFTIELPLLHREPT